MRKILKLFLWLFFCLGLIYLGYLALSRGLYSYAWMRGDYPGPKFLSHQPPASKQIDWLLLHGATLDARMWQKVIDNCHQQRLLAVSLAQHNLSTKLAKPGLEPSQEIVKLLKRYQVKHGIIAHSTGALWVANAYALCPECFANLQLYFLAPNYCFLQVSATQRMFLNVLPNIAWEGNTVYACLNGKNYQQCKDDYLYGRQYYVSNVNYYKQLLKLCNLPQTEQNIRRMQEKLGPQIHYILAAGDALIDNQRLQEFLAPYKVKLQVLEHTSHQEAYHYAFQILHCQLSEPPAK